MASTSNAVVENVQGNGWDAEHDCPTINGVLAPEPISVKPLARASGRKRRVLTAACILESKEYYFILCECKETSEYFLVMYEVVTGDKIIYALAENEKNGKRKMIAKEVTSTGNKMIEQVFGEVYTNLDNKSNLSIEQRLQGKWRIELRQRKESLKTEWFYLHEKVDRTFRSMNEDMNIEVVHLDLMAASLLINHLISTLYSRSQII